MLEPDRVLATLNQQFGMDHHDGNYFTIFYQRVYQQSTGTLRATRAPGRHTRTGDHQRPPHPSFPSQTFPLGMFEDTSFTATNLAIPPGGQMLLYSDGAYELTLSDGGQWSLQAFVDSCARLGRSPDWTLDDVVATTSGHSVSGSFVFLPDPADIRLAGPAGHKNEPTRAGGWARLCHNTRRFYTS